MNKTIRIAILALFSALLCTQLAAQDTLKVFLLLGQSNMEGQSYTYSSTQTTNWNIPTMEFLLSGTAAATNYRNNMPFGFEPSLNATWLDPRTDVWAVHYDSGNGTTKDVQVTDSPPTGFNGIGPLSPGFGVGTGFGSMFGPELAMGVRLGDAAADPIFLFKSDKGGTTLGNDWRPPTAVAARGGAIGPHYANSMTSFLAFLDTLDADLLGDGLLNTYGNATNYQVSGVFWFQGWNEQFNDAPYTAAQLEAEYKDNLKDLIYSIRAEDPRIPGNLGLIIGESSDQNVGLNAGRTNAVSELNDEIAKSAVFFDTAQMKGTDWGNNNLGVPFSQNWGFHFHARAENFLEIGWKAAGAALDTNLFSPGPLWFNTPSVSNLAPTQATATVTLSADAHEVVVVWGTNDQGTVTTTDWNNQQSLAATNAGLIQATLTGLSEGSDYVVRYYASNAVLAEVAWSPAAPFTTPWQNPPPVLGIPLVTNVTSEGAALACPLIQAAATSTWVVWDTVDQGTPASPPGTWSNSSDLGAALTNAILTETTTGGTGDTTYVFRFFAANAAGSDWSDTGTYDTGLGNEPAPSGLAVDMIDGTDIHLLWNDSYATETGFILERADDAGFTLNVLTFNTAANTTSYIDGTGDPNRTYYYRVAAGNAGGNTPFSSPESATIPAVPTPVPILHWRLDEANGTASFKEEISGDTTITMPINTVTSGVTRLAPDGGTAAAFDRTDPDYSYIAGGSLVGGVYTQGLDNTNADRLTGAWTMTAWILPDATGGGDYGIMSAGAWNSSWGWLFFIRGSQFGFDFGSTRFYSGLTVAPGQPYLLAVQRDNSKPWAADPTANSRLAMWDGTSWQYAYSTRQSSPRLTGVVIGNFRDANREFDGVIDDPRIYDTRLSDADLDALVSGALSLTKSASETRLNLDLGVTNLTYTINVANVYTSALGGVVVTDSLPAEVSFVSALPPASRTNGNELVFDLGLLGAGSNALFTIEVMVTSTVPSVVTNVATVSTTNSNIAGTRSRDTAETLLYHPTDVAITKTATVVQTNLVYTLSVTNLSAVDAANVVVTDTLSPETEFWTSTPLPSTVNGNDYTFDLGTLTASNSALITIFANYTPSLPGLVTNQANVTTTWFEDVLTNNTAELVTQVGAGAELALIKTVSPTNLPIGVSNLTYTLTVNNLGTTQAVSVVVTDTLPAGVVFVTAVPPAVQTNGNEVVFDLGTLALGASTSIVIDAAYTAGLVGVTLTNWAVVSTPTQELSLVNNTDSATTVILDPLVDTDGDGMPDSHEIIAGTLPLDPTSYLWVQIERTTNKTVRNMAFPSVLTRTYHIQSSTNFTTGPWVDVQTNILGIDALINTFRTSVLERVYYRIGVESP